MLIDRILPEARELLATVSEDAPLLDAANLLRKGIDLVVICDKAGRMAGVVTKTDVVGQMSHCGGAACTEPVAKIMTRTVVSCRPTDWGAAVWGLMKDHRLKNIPVIGDDERPAGIVTARLVLQLLLSETADEEALLRDYVMNIGYR